MSYCDYNVAVKKLFPRKRNFVKNSLCANHVDNMNCFGSFVHCSYKRSQLKYSKFIDSDMHNSAWTDSDFFNVEFSGCNLNNANLQLCIFDNCSFKDIAKINNASLNHGYYKNVEFENIEFINCVFSEAIFINCKFINCKFKSSSFDGTKFLLCEFNHLIARNLNMDYSQYRECRFYNSEISLFQCAYTTGILQSLEMSENNYFAFQGKNLPVSKFYNEYIHYLTSYFNERGEFFPLANIECYRGNIIEGKLLIEKGIKTSIQSQKYRLALHYCELINFYNCFTSAEKRQIIQFTNLCLACLQDEENISEALRYSVLIEHVLLNNYDNRTVYYISLQTDLIDEKDECIPSFVTDLDKLLSEYQGHTGEHNLTITHNSPLWLDIVLALGCGIVANYLKDGIDLIIKKIKNYAQERKIKINNITIKTVEPVNGEINDANDANDDNSNKNN